MDNTEQLTLLRRTLLKHSPEYSVDLPAETVDALVEYFDAILHWNDRLHLVAPCSPQLFATRHVLESLLLLDHLPSEAHVTDVGSGAGFPIIPCLIARPDLSAVLIESSSRKVIFLREVLKRLDRAKVAKVLASRFEHTLTPNTMFVTCRALDNFTDKLEQLYRWSPESSALLLFGGRSIADKLSVLECEFAEQQIPNSEQRFLYIVKKD